MQSRGIPIGAASSELCDATVDGPAYRGLQAGSKFVVPCKSMHRLMNGENYMTRNQAGVLTSQRLCLQRLFNALISVNLGPGQ